MKYYLISDFVTPISAEMKAMIFRTIQKEKDLLSDPRNDGILLRNRM